MSKYTKRVQSDFEKILTDLSNDSSTSFQDALCVAKNYTKDLSGKKSLSEEEQSEVLEECIDMINDWFPDVSSVFFK